MRIVFIGDNTDGTTEHSVRRLATEPIEIVRLSEKALRFRKYDQKDAPYEYIPEICSRNDVKDWVLYLNPTYVLTADPLTLFNRYLSLSRGPILGYHPAFYLIDPPRVKNFDKAEYLPCRPEEIAPAGSPAWHAERKLMEYQRPSTRIRL